MSYLVPSAESQITFLKKIQNLFDDSSFNATYKYALLITLTDLAIEYGDDSGNPLNLNSKLIATRFAEIYWPQIREYSTGIRGTRSGILSQNRGGQAEIITTLVNLQQKLGIDDFSKITLEKSWNHSLNKVVRTVWENPVFYLQDDENPFIFSFAKDRSSLSLTSEAAYCLRKFSEYITQFSKQGWLDHIKTNKRNHEIIGQKDDLASFLFGSDRTNLTTVMPFLKELQHGKCFYCNKQLTKSSDVDHFIPWKKYSRNIIENLVLSCQSCNRSKSDMLASARYLEIWLDRLVLNNERTNEIASLGFVSDKTCCLNVAKWAYQNVIVSHGKVWNGINKFELINESCLAMFNSPQLLKNSQVQRLSL